MKIYLLCLAGLLLVPETQAQVCVQTLRPEPISDFEAFGFKVDAAGDQVAISAPQASRTALGAGAVTLWELSPLTDRFELLVVVEPFDLEAGDSFGKSFEFDGTSLLVGAPGADDGALNAGAAYLFEEVGGVWVETQKFLPVDPIVDGAFGDAVDLDGDRAAFGAPGADAAYVFERTSSGWIESSKLEGPSTFGAGVIALSWPFLAVRGETGMGCRLHTFDTLLDEWIHEATIFVAVASPGTHPVLRFEGPDLIYAAWAANNSTRQIRSTRRDSTSGSWNNSFIAVVNVGTNSPTVQVTDFETLGGEIDFSVPAQSIVYRDKGSGIESEPVVHRSMSATDSHLFAGDQVFRKDCNLIGDRTCSGVPNSTGEGGEIHALGSASVAVNSVTLVASRLPEQAFGFFIASQAGGFTANPGGSQGNLCLAGEIGRYVGPGQVMSSAANGYFSLDLDLDLMPTPTGFVPAAAGQSWTFQAWHRDQNPTPTSNFTSGLRVVFQ
jgi:hypothetical protein